MKKPTLSEIERTLVTLAGPGVSPKEMLKQARKAHPKASKKDVIRAAFGALIVIAEQDPQKALMLQSFALAERTTPEVDDDRP